MLINSLIIHENVVFVTISTIVTCLCDVGDWKLLDISGTCTTSVFQLFNSGNSLQKSRNIEFVTQVWKKMMDF